MTDDQPKQKPERTPENKALLPENKLRPPLKKKPRKKPQERAT